MRWRSEPQVRNPCQNRGLLAKPRSEPHVRNPCQDRGVGLRGPYSFNSHVVVRYVQNNAAVRGCLPSSYLLAGKADPAVFDAIASQACRARPSITTLVR